MQLLHVQACFLCGFPVSANSTDSGKPEFWGFDPEFFENFTVVLIKFYLLATKIPSVMTKIPWVLGKIPWVLLKTWVFRGPEFCSKRTKNKPEYHFYWKTSTNYQCDFLEFTALRSKYAIITIGVYDESHRTLINHCDLQSQPTILILKARNIERKI